MASFWFCQEFVILLYIQLDTLILILRGENWIEKAQVELVIFLAQVSYLGTTKSKLVWPFQLQKLNTLLL